MVVTVSVVVGELRGPPPQPHPGRVYMWLSILMNSESLQAAGCWGRPDDLELWKRER